MTELPERVARAFGGHGAFQRVGAGSFEATTTPFDGVVRVRGVDPTTVEVSVRAPMLSAAVAGGEEVAPVVETGWLETFERRMEDAHMAMARDRDVEPAVSSEGESLVVEATLTDDDPSRVADDARALIEYVEGTYVEGVIPGYEYADPVAGLRSRARRAGDATGEPGREQRE